MKVALITMLCVICFSIGGLFERTMQKQISEEKPKIDVSTYTYQEKEYIIFTATNKAGHIAISQIEIR